MSTTAVLIAGAGPTGLTLALDLARRGIAIRLLEAAPTPFTGSRGKGLQPRTLEVFDDLGVIDTILASGGLYPKFRVHAGPISFHAGSLGTARSPTESVPYPNLWLVPQARTEEILRERLHTFGVEVEFGKSLTSFVQDDHGVKATLATGESVDAQFLVGCDGGHSTVRKVLGLTLQGDALEEKPVLLADVEVNGLDRRDWHLWPLAKGGVLGLCPLPGTPLFQFTARAEPDEVAARISAVTGYQAGIVAWTSIYRPAVRMVDRFRVGRVFLAGDAAHIHPPTGGQGLNTGVQDAYNLGWKLAYVVRGGPDSWLDTYQAERLPIAAAVLGLSKQLLQTRSIKRGDATNQLALHYRGSPLSSGDSFGNLQPGDRIPDLRLANGKTLFQQRRGGKATEIVTKEGPRILVRPDGYIATIGTKPSPEYAGEATQPFRLDRNIPPSAGVL